MEPSNQKENPSTGTDGEEQLPLNQGTGEGAHVTESLNVPRILVTGEDTIIVDAGKRTSSSSPNSIPADVVARISSQWGRFLALKRIRSKLEEGKGEVKAINLDFFAQDAAETMDELKEAHSLVESSCPAVLLGDTYFTESLMGQAKQVYTDIRYEIGLLKDQLNPKEDSSSQVPSQRLVKLPELRLPTFSGSYTEWRNFKGLFNTMVLDDSRLSDMEKFHYLWSSLSGLAKEVASGFPLVGESLKPCMQALVKLYENKRYILGKHLEELSSIPTAQAKHAVSLNKAVTSVDNTRKAMLSLEEDKKLADCFFSHSLIKKLDQLSCEAWETHASSFEEYPAYDELHKFMLDRVKALELMRSSGSDQRKSQVGKAHKNSHSSSKVLFVGA